MQRLLIAFEGPDGCGKSTQINKLVARFRELSVEPMVTRQPGGTQLGLKIREIVKYAEYPVSPEAELLLFAADKAQHVTQLIAPALRDNTIVICDRYTGSTAVYQGYARGIPSVTIKAAMDIAVVGLRPDIEIVLDIPVEVSMQRIQQRMDPEAAGRVDRFEKRHILETVREGYLRYAKEFPGVQVVDGTQDADVIHEQIWDMIRDHLWADLPK